MFKWIYINVKYNNVKHQKHIMNVTPLGGMSGAARAVCAQDARRD